MTVVLQGLLVDIHRILPRMLKNTGTSEWKSTQERILWGIWGYCVSWPRNVVRNEGGLEPRILQREFDDPCRALYTSAPLGSRLHL
jgi:hypothetical protein